jgi:uncharacterized protein (DUF427 family)
MSEPTRTASPGPGFARRPEYLVQFVPCPKRVRAMAGGVPVADSTRAMLMREAGHPPVYYFRRDDVRLDLLQRTATSTH